MINIHAHKILSEKFNVLSYYYILYYNSHVSPLARRPIREECYLLLFFFGKRRPRALTRNFAISLINSS